ncbi:transmembrane protein 245 isoform X3 [Lucilia sericata]|uniref:transmembrane protein 245 isoform X3 n=1 Tax=Lucilia sericata TaxID=13632 RepID=UPI0018A803C8|nr:transmembrane protein 245 isoform X3 [Lucilia sericata]
MNRSDSIRRDRSFDSVLNKLMRMRSQNHESFKAAMYNFLIAAGIAAFVAVCFILGPFVRPLLWAFLMGAVLFPFKRKLAQLLNGWFERLEERDSNVLVALSLAPLEATENCGRFLVDWLKEHWQVITAGVGIATCMKLLVLYAPKGFLCAVWRIIVFSHSLFVQMIGFLNIYLLAAIVAVYLTSVYFFWKPSNSNRFIIAGQSLWIAIISYVCSFLGALQVPVFIMIMLYVGASIIYHLRTTEESSSIVEKLKKLLDKTDFEKSISALNFKNVSQHSDIEDVSFSETMDSVETLEAYEVKEDITEEHQHLSDTYFKFLFYACIITFLYRNVWMFILAAIPIFMHLMFTLGKYTGFTDFISAKINDVYEKIKSWAIEHHSAVLPLCLPGILELNYKINTVVRDSLKSSVDLVTSILMIILMILIIVFLGVFFCVNIYSETIEVAYLGKDLINKTITDRPELIDILPANMQSSIDDALDNAHHYGRRKIETYIDDWLTDADPIHATKLKEQILDVWDRLIQYWIDFNKSDSYGPRVPTDALKSTFGEIVDNPGHFKELVLVAKQGIIGWAKSNTQTIMEVAESLWHIIRTNLSMIMTFTGEILSLVLSGGQACVEFILDMIVFFTALFYLLSSSQTKYAPLQVTKHLGVSSSGSKIAEALENSISGVLISMFKSSIFTGLFTWLVHTIFGARIVFLPSALAAILSAAPFLGSYWCALPALLEIWLAQDRLYAGVVLFLLQFFVPPYFEAAIYAEMKGGGHPYLTGLAIAGGMYWIGWQGAIFGPLMLCFFIGIFEVAAVAMRANEDARRSSDEDTRTTNIAVVDAITQMKSVNNEHNKKNSIKFLNQKVSKLEENKEMATTKKSNEALESSKQQTKNELLTNNNVNNNKDGHEMETCNTNIKMNGNLEYNKNNKDKIKISEELETPSGERDVVNNKANDKMDENNLEKSKTNIKMNGNLENKDNIKISKEIETPTNRDVIDGIETFEPTTTAQNNLKLTEDKRSSITAPKSVELKIVTTTFLPATFEKKFC